MARPDRHQVRRAAVQQASLAAAVSGRHGSYRQRAADNAERIIEEFDRERGGVFMAGRASEASRELVSDMAGVNGAWTSTDVDNKL
jgi:hypothetical protein